MHLIVRVEGTTHAELEQGLQDALAGFIGDSEATAALIQSSPAAPEGSVAVLGPDGVTITSTTVYAITATYDVTTLAPSP